MEEIAFTEPSISLEYLLSILLSNLLKTGMNSFYFYLAPEKVTLSFTEQYPNFMSAFLFLIYRHKTSSFYLLISGSSWLTACSKKTKVCSNLGISSASFVDKKVQFFSKAWELSFVAHQALCSQGMASHRTIFIFLF